MMKDEIMAMEAGRELDALGAENVMGWERAVIRKYAGESWKTGDELMAGVEYWHPSTDIAAAWEVVDKFTDVDIEKAGNNYRVTISAFAQVDAYCAPLAISKAALLAVMDQKHGKRQPPEANPMELPDWPGG